MRLAILLYAALGLAGLAVLDGVVIWLLGGLGWGLAWAVHVLAGVAAVVGLALAALAWVAVGRRSV
jgi:hypothetical protein